MPFVDGYIGARIRGALQDTRTDANPWLCLARPEGHGRRDGEAQRKRGPPTHAPFATDPNRSVPSPPSPSQNW